MIKFDGYDFSTPMDGLVPIMILIASLISIYIYFIPALILHSKGLRDDYVVMLLGFGGLSAAILSSIYDSLGGDITGQILVGFIIISWTWIRALRHVLSHLLR